MEFKLTTKHLVVSTVLGSGLVFFFAYLGLDAPERYFYTGTFNSHEPTVMNAGLARLRNDPEWAGWRQRHPHVVLDEVISGADCNACHMPADNPDQAWKEVSNQTCSTSGCHGALQPGTAYSTSYNIASDKYHQRIKNVSCSECHTTHLFRPEERTWYGKGFNHALFIPEWHETYNCSECHTPFDRETDVVDVLLTVNDWAGEPQDEVRAAAVEWLADAPRLRLQRELDGLLDDGVRGAPVAVQFSEAALETATLDGTAGALLYFRSQADFDAGGPSAYVENELLRMGIVIRALGAITLIVVDKDAHQEAYTSYGAIAPGVFMRVWPGGTTRWLNQYSDPADVVRFFRQPLPTESTAQATETSLE